MMTNAIYGFSGHKLTEVEITFFKEVQPCGYILFKRNIDTPSQLQELTTELKEITGNADLLILIDQEGGRVRRLKPPHFRECKPTGDYAILAEKDFAKALKAVELNHYLLGIELSRHGINVDCAPVADLRFDWAHDIVGDRSFGHDPESVSKLCQAAIKGLNNAGVIEVIKHIPGHGRALADSHLELPRVTTPLAELEQTDFVVFKNLHDANFAMTAHIIFDALDGNNSITHSAESINYIRNELGFSGLIISDDLSMQALSGSLQERAEKAAHAGCDILLHCNGKMGEMVEVARAASNLEENPFKQASVNLEIVSPKHYGSQSLEELEALLESYFL